MAQAAEQPGLTLEGAVRLGELEPAGCVWASLGVSTERIDLFLAAYTEADRTGAGGGLETENENITVVETPLADLWAACEGEVPADAKTRILVQTLRLRRPELFG